MVSNGVRTVALVQGAMAFTSIPHDVRSPSPNMPLTVVAETANSNYGETAASSQMPHGAAVGFTSVGTASLFVAAMLKATPRKARTKVCYAPISNTPGCNVINSSGCRGASSIGKTGGAGTCEPIPTKWDPMQLGHSDAKMERYTTVEIKHGRISMIATAGYVLPTFFRFPGCETFKNGLGAFESIPPEGWAQIVAFIGAHEVFVRPRDGGMGGYDLGLGTELIQGIDPVEVERRQTVERNNGRLAMIGIMGMMIQDGLFGVDPITYMQREGWWGQPVDWLVKDLPYCVGGGGGGCAIAPPKKGPGLTAMRASKSRSSSRTARNVVVYDIPSPKLDQDINPEMSRSLPWLRYPEPLRGWVGGEPGFDPMYITQGWPTYIAREAELKHGRVCMLATIGWVATDLGARFPADIFQKATTISAHDDMVAAGLMQPFFATLGCMELYGGFLLHEGWKNALSDGGLKRDAGDFFVGKRFLPQDPEQADSMRLKELKNGRLAMLGFSGIVTQAVLTNSTFPFF